MTRIAISDSFDINKSVSIASGEVLSNISREFADALKAVQVVPVWEQIMLYLGTVVDILFSPTITTFESGKLGELPITISSMIVSEEMS